MKRTLIRFDRWAPFVALRISRAGGSRLLHLVGPHMHHLPAEKIRTLISLAELSDDRTLVPLLRHRLKATRDDQEKAMILRALGRLGSQRDCEVLLPLLHDPNWILRVQAVKTYARLGSEVDIPRLDPLLQDPEWWVRFRAAQAVWTLLHRNAERLRQFMRTLRHPDALTVLEHILAEQAVQA